MHEDPVAKSKRITNSSGTVVSTVELDPWGGDTTRSSNEAFQPRRFTTYDRDGNGSDDAMHRRYNRWHMRFDQPDPYGGSYDMTDPQSFNRYSYVQNDPVNFVDPLGLNPQDPLGPPPPMPPSPREPPPPPEPTGPLDTITTNTWDHRPGTATGGDTQFRTEAPPHDGDGSGGGGGRQPGPQEQNDCITFADAVDTLAQEASTDAEFISRLYQRFSDRNDFRFLAEVLDRNL